MDLQTTVDESITAMEMEFPGVSIECTEVTPYEDIFISTSDASLYYSEEYQKKIIEVKHNILWKNNIHNVYFVLDRESAKQTVT